MKTRTNQPIFKDDGTPFTDSQLESDISQKGGTKLYRHNITIRCHTEDLTEFNFTLVIFSFVSDNFATNKQQLDIQNVVSCQSFKETTDNFNLYLINMEYSSNELTLTYYSFNENDIYMNYVFEIDDISDIVAEL